MKLFLRDPLVHFLGAGLVIFIAVAWISPAKKDDQIIVDRAGLLTFIQYRSRAFEPNAAEALLASMSEADRKRLIDDYLQEEALYREAEKLGLDDGDYVIRRRMVQKLEFMAEAAIGERTFSDDELRAFYESNRNDYAEPARLTFSHVYLSKEGRDVDELESEALRLLEDLSAANAKFEDATRFGERFLFHTNYVERTQDYVASQLGGDLTAALLDEQTPLNAWSGPFHSEYGVHVVYLTARAQETVASFDDVRLRIEEDVRRITLKEEQQAVIADIIANYNPVIAEDLQTTLHDEQPE